MEQFQFAGFTFPRPIAMLPQGTLAHRLHIHRTTTRTSGPYYTAPKTGADGKSFYLNSDFMPGLRWEWADEIDGVRIGHYGWFTDDDGTNGEAIRGLVMRLPKSRGFIAGWSMGEHMASSVEYAVWDNEANAARHADRLAEIAAEHERDYRREQEEEDDDTD